MLHVCTILYFACTQPVETFRKYSKIHEMNETFPCLYIPLSLVLSCTSLTLVSVAPMPLIRTKVCQKIRPCFSCAYIYIRT